MTDRKPDWADEIENRIADEYASHGAILAADADGMIAAALRKAKADGWNECQMQAYALWGCMTDPVEIDLALSKMRLEIEKGKE